jgi:hypothetical protein
LYAARRTGLLAMESALSSLMHPSIEWSAAARNPQRPSHEISPEKQEAAGPDAGEAAPEALLPAHRTGLRRLGAALYSFSRKRHPKDMGPPEIEAFLTHLAVDRQVAASTQHQALSALLFLYREVLDMELEGHIHLPYARRPKRLPSVLSREEALAVIHAL